MKAVSDACGRPRHLGARAATECFTDFVRWRASFAPVCEVAAPSTERLNWGVIAYNLRDIFLHVLSGSPSTFDRSDRVIEEKPLDRLLFIMCLEGHLELRSAGRSESVKSGSTLALDLNRPFLIRAETFEAVTLMVPRAKVPALLPDTLHSGSLLKAGTPGGKLMAGSTRALVRAVAGATPDQAEAIVLAFLDLAADLFAAARGCEWSAGTIVARHLRPNLARADLSEGSVARLAGLGIPDLVRFFGGRGGLRDTVASLRLEAASRYKLIDRDIAELILARLVGYSRRSEFQADVLRRDRTSTGIRSRVHGSRCGTGALL